MTKKYWFGHSLVWIGVFSNSPEAAIAETISVPPSDPLPQPTQVSLPVIKTAKPSISAPEAIVSMERSNQNFAQSNRDFAAIDPPTTADSEIAGSEVDASVLNEATAIDLELNELSDPSSEMVAQNQEANSAQTTEDTASEPADPELGRLRLRESPVPIEPRNDQDVVFLRGRLDYFRSDNILLDEIDPIDDQFTRAGLSLVATPSLGANTQLFASIGGNFGFYGDLSELNYRNLELRAEVQQTIFPNTYATIGWSNRQFFSADDGDRFLNDHAVRLILSRRDSLAERLSLDSYYQLRFNFSDPIDRSRLTNSIGASLNYELQQNLEVGLNYQLDLIDFTQQERNDAYHQVTAQLRYDLTRNSRISLYGGFSFGSSSDSDINFDSSIVGVSFSTYLSLF